MRRVVLASVSALAAAVMLPAALVVSAPAWAAPTTEVVQGEVLRLVSVADWDAASNLLPGEPVRWDVTVSADAPEPGTVTIALSATGEAPLRIDAALCDEEWQEDGCPGGARVLREDWAVPRDGAEVTLVRLADSEVGRLRFSVALEDGGSGSSTVLVHAHGAGDSVVAGPGGELPPTGMSPAVFWVLGIGAVLVVLGGVLLVARRRRGGGDGRGADAEDGGVGDRGSGEDEAR